MDTTSPLSAPNTGHLHLGPAGLELPASGSVVLRGFSWEKYQGLLALAGDDRLPHTYAEGTLEIMSPSQKHERESDLLCLLVQQAAITLDQEFVSLGSWTLNSKDSDKGLEPDNCFYLTNEPAVQFRDDINLDKDPPPDLAIEIDVTSSSLARMPVYAALGVPEVWRYDGQSLIFFVLHGGDYQASDRSKALPFLTSAKLQELLGARSEKTELQIVKEFVAWVRANAGE